MRMNKVLLTITALLCTSVLFAQNYSGIVLEKDGKRFEFDFNADVRTLYGNNTAHTLKLEAVIPAEMARGTYKAGIALPDGCQVLANVPEYAIRLANDVRFADGINYLDMNIEIN